MSPFLILTLVECELSWRSSKHTSDLQQGRQGAVLCCVTSTLAYTHQTHRQQVHKHTRHIHRVTYSKTYTKYVHLIATIHSRYATTCTCTWTTISCSMVTCSHTRSMVFRIDTRSQYQAVLLTVTCLVTVTSRLAPI